MSCYASLSRRASILDRIDEILDDIDAALDAIEAEAEASADALVAAYVQQGGE